MSADHLLWRAPLSLPQTPNSQEHKFEDKSIANLVDGFRELNYVYKVINSAERSAVNERTPGGVAAADCSVLSGSRSRRLAQARLYPFRGDYRCRLCTVGNNRPGIDRSDRHTGYIRSLPLVDSPLLPFVMQRDQLQLVTLA